MKKSKRICIFVLLGVIITLLQVQCIYRLIPKNFYYYSFDRDDANELQKEYYNELSVMVEFLFNQEDDDVTIWATDYEYGNRGDITDDEILFALDLLIAEGCNVISKEGNTAYFQFRSTLDAGKGIAFLNDGDNLEIDYLTFSSALDSKQWYYYVSDYNEFR